MPKSKRDKLRSRWYRRHRSAWRYLHKKKRTALKRFTAFQAKVTAELDEKMAGRLGDDERGDTCSSCWCEQRHGMIFWWLETSGEYGAKEYEAMCPICAYHHVHRYDDWDACLEGCGRQFVNPGLDKGKPEFSACPECNSTSIVSRC